MVTLKKRKTYSLSFKLRMFDRCDLDMFNVFLRYSFSNFDVEFDYKNVNFINQ